MRYEFGGLYTLYLGGLFFGILWYPVHVHVHVYVPTVEYSYSYSTVRYNAEPLFPDRSFPRHKMFIQGTSEGKEGRAALFRVLAVYALYNPEVSYCQGNPTHAPVVFLCVFVLTSPVMLNGLCMTYRSSVLEEFHYFDRKKN